MEPRTPLHVRPELVRQQRFALGLRPQPRLLRGERVRLREERRRPLPRVPPSRWRLQSDQRVLLRDPLRRKLVPPRLPRPQHQLFREHVLPPREPLHPRLRLRQAQRLRMWPPLVHQLVGALEQLLLLLVDRERCDDVEPRPPELQEPVRARLQPGVVQPLVRLLRQLQLEQPELPRPPVVHIRVLAQHP